MLILPLDARNVPLHRQIYQGLRERILDGRLRPGERLPSTRRFASLLGVGRNTVLEAFDMLLAEGYLEARTGSGTYVTASLPDAPPMPVAAESEPARASLPLSTWAFRARSGPPLAGAIPPDEARLRVRFRNGYLPERPFPWRTLERIARLRLAYPSPATYQYGGVDGWPELRRAIAEYVTRARGVRCTAEQIFVTAGSQGALDLLARTLLDVGDRLAIEDPAYPGARRTFTAAGAELIPVSVDAGGLVPEQLPEAARLLYLTPSHQFPTGAVLPISRRLAVLEWAARTGAWVVEDDYDSEYRYGGRPLAAMQGLAPERVVYVGTFSKALYPGFRLGFLIAPASLVEVLREVRYVVDRQPPSLEQALLVDLLNDGHFERHLRQMRLLYARKRVALLKALRYYLPSWSWDDSEAGLHLYVRLPQGTSEATVIKRAAEAGIGVYGASQYYASPDSAPPALVLGYAHLDEPTIEQAIAAVARALRPGSDGSTGSRASGHS